MSHCRSSTVVSISDTLVSELVTLSTNSLYCKKENRHHGYTLGNNSNSILTIHSSNWTAHTRNVDELLYLHRHLVVFALQEGGQVSQAKVLLQHSDVCTDYVRLTVIFTCC